MIDEVREDRRYFASLRDQHPQGSGKRNAYGIDAAACAIREKALRDALAAIRAEARP